MRPHAHHHPLTRAARRACRAQAQCHAGRIAARRRSPRPPTNHRTQRRVVRAALALTRRTCTAT